MNDELKIAILAVPDWKTKSPADLLAAIVTVTREKKPEAERIWSIAGIAKEFGMTVAETIYGALLASGMPGIAARFAATGLDATDPQWGATADALIAGPLASLDAETQMELKYIGFNASALFDGAIDEEGVSAAKAGLIDAVASSDAYKQIVARANQAVAAANLALEAERSAAQVIAAGEGGWDAV